MRSAWIKWARATEHQRVLARATRKFSATDSYEYVRTDNNGDDTDPLVKVHWRLRIKQPYPERWSVLIGDILTNLRAALDHAFWVAVVTHSGQPAHPHRVTFPISTNAAAFAQKTTKELGSLVAPEVWTLIDAVQPFHGGAAAHTSPLEILRWLSNLDKHRTVHVVGRTAFDLAPVIVKAATPIEIVDEWRLEGQVKDNAAVVRLKFKRPLGNHPLDLVPTFAHIASIRISEQPEEFRSLGGVMSAMGEQVLAVLVGLTNQLNIPFPDPDGFELGEAHEAFAAEFGGNLGIFREHDGTVHRVNLSGDLPE